jgi:hypothetical protein
MIMIMMMMMLMMMMLLLKMKMMMMLLLLLLICCDADVNMKMMMTTVVSMQQMPHKARRGNGGAAGAPNGYGAIDRQMAPDDDDVVRSTQLVRSP